MPRLAPDLAIDSHDFEFELIKAKKQNAGSTKDAKGVNYVMIPFKYAGKKALVKVSGAFRTFTYETNGKIRYSIGMDEDETNEEFLRKLERRLRFARNCPMSVRKTSY